MKEKTINYLSEYEKWLDECKALLTEAANYDLIHEQYAIVRVWVYQPTIENKVKLIGVKGENASEKIRERTFPVAFVLRATPGTAPVGSILKLNDSICEDTINPSWIRFNEEMRERPAPTVIEEPPMYLRGIDSWSKQKIKLNPFGEETKQNNYCYLIPNAFIQARFKDENSIKGFIKSLQVESSVPVSNS